MNPREELVALRRLAELEAKGAGQIPGAGPYVAPPAPTEIPLGRRMAAGAVRNLQSMVTFVEPTVEALGTVGGAALGTAGAPGPGTVTGAGAGYSAARGVLRAAKTALGMESPETLEEASAARARDVLIGGSMESFGRGVVGPTLEKGFEYASRVRNLKLDTYLKAMEGKGEDILNALRGPRAAVPGAAPGAGEVAAPAGSTGFAVLQAKAEKVPSLATEFATGQAQTTAAQAAQQGRAQAKFDAAAARVQSKMNSALAPMRPEDAGAALVAGAEAQRTAVKKSVIEPAYNRAFGAAGDAKIDMSDVIAETEKILGRKLSDFDPSTAPETVRKLLSLQPKAPPAKPLGAGVISGKIKQAAPPAPPPEVTLQQLDDIRKAINVDIAAGRTSMDPGAGMRLRNLGKIHAAIDDAVDGAPALTDQAKTLYREALDTYRTEYVPRFKTGVNEQLFRSTALNEPKIKPEDVITKYFQPRGVSEARNFVELFGKDPKAVQVARSGIEDLYLREVKTPTPEAHAEFLRKYADPIKVLDDAGMNVLQRINVVGTNAARLQKIDELAARTNVKLAPPLPPGASADAVTRRLEALTKGLSQQQLSHVGAVQQDLLRRGEYERLVKAGTDAGIDIKQIGTKTGRELGIPLPNFLSVPITIFNATAKRLALYLDDRLAMEIAREMTDPALAAASVSQALKLQTSRQLRGRVAPEVGRAATMMVGPELARRSEEMPYNALAPQPTNALAP